MTHHTPKSIKRLLPRQEGHWVGDGFPVSSVLSPSVAGNDMSPFILFDYAAPMEFEPSTRPRGVDVHPHRGFETVTVVYRGELAHRDSAGNSGKLFPGDVQWMTAAAGILHEEKHSEEFTRRGGMLEMAQLWVNLPARAKMSPPRYQELAKVAIPVVALPDDAGSVRVIAGELRGTPGAATTVTPVILWDVKLDAGKSAEFPVPAGYTSGVFVRTGAVTIGEKQLTRGDFAILDTAGDALVIEAAEAAELLILGGEPIDEPVVAYGPFVMNTEDEIRAAIGDLRAGKFGELTPA